MRETIKPIFEATLEGGINIAATLDTRNSRKNTPISIRVSYQRRSWYYGTGISLPLSNEKSTGRDIEKDTTLEDYDGIRNAKGGKGKYSPIKVEIQRVFDKVKGVVNEMKSSKSPFTLTGLKENLSRQNAPLHTSKTLYQLWTEYGESKDSNKTREQYRQASISFYKSLGCDTHRIEGEDGKPSRKMILSGRALSLKPEDLTPKKISDWEQHCKAIGNSQATISMYQRALRALLNHLQEEGIIQERPKYTIKNGGRRQDDFITVPDILKIKAYQGEYKAQADWWLLLYLMNGLNLKDASELRYNDDYKFNHELSFIRSKTSHKTPSRVFIPIIPELEELLKVYAADPKDGELVFPQILSNAKTETQRDSRVHDFNAWIREGMSEVCESLGIKPVTASTARNSYVTCLTWHGTSDAFIDVMVGHSSGNELLRGYQGKISPKKRLRINELLLVDPEEEEEEDNDGIKEKGRRTKKTNQKL